MHQALAAAALGLAWLCACGKRGESPAPSASVAFSSTPQSSATPSTSMTHLAQVKPSCRALAVVGTATVDGAPIVTGTVLDGEHWVELDAGASVALRHSLTSRELRLLGPGLVLPCRHGAEQVLLAQGRLQTSQNLGVRPGAEVLIATPLGTIRYGDAAIDVELGSKGLHLRVKQGEAWLDPQAAGVRPFKNPLRSADEVALPPGKIGPTALAEACAAAAEVAAESARRVLGTAAPEPARTPPGPEPSLGERAAAQIRDRSGARAACSMAAAAAGSVLDPAARQSLWASIAHSDELWQSVPRAISAQKN